MKSTHIRACGSRVCRVVAFVSGLILALPLAAQQLTLRHFAGAPVLGGPDGAITDTSINSDGANTITRDSAGNLYLAEWGSHAIRKISPSGTLSTVAGLYGTSGWADGARIDARFNSPMGIHRDDAGNLWVADTSNHVIRKIAPDGRVTTVAGQGGVSGLVNGTSSAARFNQPRGIAVDHTGVVYVSDYGNGVIRKIATDGTVSTFFATVGSWMGLDVDAANNLYAVDSATVNRFTPAGVRTIIAGAAGSRGYADGTGAAARFDTLRDIAVAADGSVMYVTEQWNGRIRKLTAAGVVTTVAGQSGGGPQLDGTGSAARFTLGIAGIVLDESTGTLYVADRDNIRVVTLPGGTVTTQGNIRFGSATGPARSARFYEARGLAVDNAGNVYASDDNNYVIRKITPAGNVTTFAGNGTNWGSDGPHGTASFLQPRALTTDGTNVYAIDGGYTVRKIAPDGSVTTLAGLLGASGSADGTGSAARFNSANDLVYDAFSNCLYVADAGNYTVRKVTLAGVVTTLAGLAGVQGTQNGTGSGARFKGPSYIAADPTTGNLFVTEWSTYHIRKITQAGVVTTFSGSTSTDAHADGNSTTARYKSPSGLAYDGGYLYVVDFWGPTVRKVSASDGSVTTVLGTPLRYGTWREGTGLGAQMSNPQRIATNRNGTFFIIDANGDFIATAMPALADTATANPATAAVGVTRQLDATARTATSYRWEMARRPALSSAEVSSPTLPNPIFTPDVIDRTTFRLYAEASGASSVTTVDVDATCNTDPPSIAITSGSNPSCAGNSVTLDAGAFATYAWSGGATTRTITVTPAQTTTYSVTVTDSNGCARPAGSVTINVTAALSAVTISGSGATAVCPSASGGTFTAATTGGGTTALQWGYRTVSGGAVTNLAGRTGASYVLTASDFAPGSYLLVATGTPACGGAVTSNEIPITIHPAPATPSITASGPTTFCEGGSVTLTASSGTSYLWSNGATTQAINVNASGSYGVTVTNANGCSATSAATNVTVNANPATPIITPSGPTTFCEGGSVTLTAPAAASYLWSNGATTQSIDVSASGSYSVTVTNANGCSATSAPASVTVNANPATPAITASGPTTFCEGGSVILIAPVATSYLWSNGATTRSILVTATGSYGVTVTNAAGCSATSAPTAVTVNSKPATPVITTSGPTTFCEGGSVTLTAPAAASYLWSNGATTQSIVVTTSGSYTVTVSNENGCSASSAAVVVDAHPIPPATITASSTTLCEFGQVTLSAPAGYAYSWSNGATTQSITVTSAGTYSVTVSDGICSNTSAPVTVVQESTTVSIAGSDNTPCPGDTVTVTSNVNGTAASYQWYGFGGQPLPGETGPNLTFVVTAGGTRYVTLHVTTPAGCVITSNTFIYTATQPDATITANGPTTFCEGAWVELSVPDAPGQTYLWSTGATSRAITVSTSGSYSVTVTNANGCSSSGTPVAVTVNTPPAATITPSGPTTFCEGGSVTLTAPAGYSYSWSNGATTQAITVSTSGSYSVTVTNANGCSAVSAPVIVTANANPSTPLVSTSGPTTFCQGGSVTLTAPAGYSYTWSNGATTQAITVSTSGSYSVTVTNANGCSAVSAPVTVTANANPPTPVVSTSGPTTFCQGGSVTLTAPAGYSYSWSNGATTQAITVSTSGAYSVTVTNANGCSAISTPVTVTANANPPTPVVSTSGPTTFCQGGSVTLAAPAGYSYTWSNGATTQAIAISSSGAYSVTVTNVNGCSAVSAPVIVTVNANPATPVVSTSGPTTFCQGGSVTLTAPAGYSYTWSNGATTQAITVSTSGAYSVTITNANGCSAVSAPVTVTANANPPTPLVSTSGPTTFCQGGSVTLTAPAGYSYTWSNGATTQAITVSTSGNYSVTATNASGCSAVSASTAVTVNPLPSQPVISGPTSFCPGTSITLTAPAGFASYAWSNGATTQSITVSTAANYTVTVTNAQGCSRTSAVYAVTQNAATVITAQPQNLTLPRNQTGQLSVTATGTPVLQYQWYSGLSGDTSTPVNGGNGPSLTVSFPKKGTYRYWVRVTSATCTGSTVNSNTATVTVN